MKVRLRPATKAEARPFRQMHCDKFPQTILTVVTNGFFCRHDNQGASTTECKDIFSFVTFAERYEIHFCLLTQDAALQELDAMHLIQLARTLLHSEVLRGV